MLVALCVPLSASACNEPRISFSPHEAGPGETVGYAISDTEAGAEYVVKVGGTRVAEGTDADGGGLRGSFTMPDLGDEPTNTYVEILVAHEGTWADSGAMAYRGRPAPVTSDPAQPGATEPAETPAPVSSSTPAAAPPARPHAGSDPAAQAPASPGTPGRQLPVRRRDAADAAPARDRSGSEAARRPRARARVAVPVATDRSTASESVRSAARASRQRAVDEPSSTGRPAARPRVVPRAEPGVRPVLDARAEDRSSSLPLPLVALLAAGAVAGLALLVQRRRGQGPAPQATFSPPLPEGGSPADLELEAGLQEIVAEGRARELLEQGSDAPAERLRG